MAHIVENLQEEVSLRSITNEELTSSIEQFGRNRNPLHVQGLEDGSIVPTSPAEEKYVALIGERDYRIGIGKL